MSRRLFHKNLSLFKKREKRLFELAVSTHLPSNFHIFNANSGEPTLKVGEISFHSLKSPSKTEKENIKEWAKKINIFPNQDIFVFGLGLFYHIEQIASFFPENKIVVYEPDPRFLRAILEYRDLSDIIDKIEIKIGSLIPLDLDFHYFHPPSLRFHSKFMSVIRKNKKIKKGILPPLRLKILVVGPIYGGSLPIASYVANAFKKMNYQTEFVDCSIFKPLYEKIQENVLKEENKLELLKHLNYLLSQYCLAKAADFSPHLLMAVAQAPLLNQTIEEMKKNGIVTCFWFVENYKILTYWKDTAPYYDFYFTIQRDKFFEELENVGVKNYHYLPVAADPDIHRPLELSIEEKKRYGSQISFLGAGYYNRRKLFSRFLGMDFKIWGTEWENSGPLIKHLQEGGRRLPPEECVKVYNASKINLNLHSSFTAKGIEKDGDFLNPRTFELASCQAFQLVDARKYLSEHFAIGDEIICFSKDEQLVSLVDYYLKNQQEIKRISENAYKRVQKEHTYVHRMERLIETIWEKPPLRWIKETEDEKISREKLIAVASKDKDLMHFISSFPLDADLSLDEIVSQIDIGKYELKEYEIIFLLMKEFKKEFSKVL